MSFIITDLLGKTVDVGNDVGTLGFADELVALVACPLWGLLSDRVGVRTVSTSRCIHAIVLTTLGVLSRICYRRRFALYVCPGEKCLSPAASSTALL